jgi:hypothetical protein
VAFRGWSSSRGKSGVFLQSVCESVCIVCVCVGVSECVRVCVCVCVKKTCGVWRGRWAGVQGSVLGFSSVQFSPVLPTSLLIPSPPFFCLHAFYLSLFCLFSPCRVFSACATLFSRLAHVIHSYVRPLCSSLSRVYPSLVCPAGVSHSFTLISTYPPLSRVCHIDTGRIW